MGDDFGNYLIRGIEEIQLPEGVSWWPQASGWYVVGALLLGWLGYRLVAGLRRWSRNRYRREALRRLALALAVDREAALRQLPVLLKGVALHAYPRHEVAALSGYAWCAFLDSRYQGPSFAHNGLLPALAYGPGNLIIDRARAKALLTMARRWIKRHREGRLV